MDQKKSYMRILQNILFVVFIIALATHNFALRKEMTAQAKDIHERELTLRAGVKALRAEQKTWRAGYDEFESRKESECKKILGLE